MSDVDILTEGVVAISVGTVGPPGPVGPTGPQGPEGPMLVGASQGNRYVFAAITAGDPTSGRFLLNNSTPSLATALHVSETDAANTAQGAMLAAMDDTTSARRTLIRFISPDGLKGVMGYVTGALTDAGVYVTFPWEPLTNWGTLNNGDTMFLSWVPVGEKGDQGIQGETGDTGPQGIIADAPSNGTTYGRKDAAWLAVVPASAAAVPFTPIGNIAANDVQEAIQELDTEKVAKGGDTMTGNFGVSKVDPAITLTKSAAAQHAGIYGHNGATARWLLSLGNAIAESVNDAGSEAALYSYTDAGAYKDQVLNFSRATGLGVVKGDPTAALGIATKQYMDDRAVRYNDAQSLLVSQQEQARKNIAAAPFDALAHHGLVVNGGMTVAQETPGGAAVTVGPSANAYVCDLYLVQASATTLVFSASQLSDLGTIGCALSITCQVTGTRGTAGIGLVQTAIEGDRTMQLWWGTSAAKPLTLAFYVLSTVAGVIPLAIRNSANDRSYVTQITINAGSTWEFKTVTIPGDQAGTWLRTRNTVGVRISFGLCMGTNYNVPSLDTWTAGNYVSCAGTIDVGSVASRVFYLGGLFAVPGNEAPTSGNFIHIFRPFSEELDLVKRYWRKSYDYASPFGTVTEVGQISLVGICNSATAIGGYGTTHTFDRPMRTAPTVFLAHPATGTLNNARGWTTAGVYTGTTPSLAISENGFNIGVGGFPASFTPGSPAELIFQYAANARFI